MRVLITGVAGFIGSTLSERFLEEGHEVFGVDNFVTGRADNVPAEVVFAATDIHNREWFYRFANIARPNLIVHCAASYSNPNLWHRDVDSNVAGSINVALAARYHHAEVVYFQTILPPISSYAISKIAGEHYLTMSEVPLTIYRLANVYGPRNLSGAVPAFYRKLTAGEEAVVTETERNFVHVSDLERAVIDNLGHHGEFGIAGAEMTPILDIFLTMRELMGIEGEYTLIPRPADDVASIRPPVPPPAGWYPETELADGLRSAIDWYETHGVSAAYTHLELKT